MAEEDPTTLWNKKYYKACKVIKQMLEDRGYSPVNESDELWLINEFEQAEFDPICNLIIDSPHLFQNSETSDILTIAFNTDEKLKQKDFSTKYYKLISESNSTCHHLILIHKDGAFGPMAAKYKKILATKGIKFETFCYEELQYNLTLHSYVPKHKVLTNEEKKDLFQRYKINETQLPQILSTDPVVRYYGANPGMVIEITRRSDTCGRYVTFRLVK